MIQSYRDTVPDCNRKLFPRYANNHPVDKPDEKSAEYISRMGRLNYEAYREHSKGKSLLTGLAIPPWESMEREIQVGWEAGALRVIGAVSDDLSAIIRDKSPT